MDDDDKWYYVKPSKRYKNPFEIFDFKYNKIFMKNVFPFKNGINPYNLRMTDVGLYSITHYKEADLISQTILKIMQTNNIIITESNGGLGGNTLSFVKYFKFVNVVEINMLHSEILLNNVHKVYGYKNFSLITNNYSKIFNMIKQDVIFIDVPWGGKDYKFYLKLKLYMNNENLSKFIKKLNASLIILKVPYNFDFDDLKSEIYSLKEIVDVQNLKNYYIIYLKDII